jgi:hypothetical protein
MHIKIQKKIGWKKYIPVNKKIHILILIKKKLFSFSKIVFKTKGDFQKKKKKFKIAN